MNKKIVFTGMGVISSIGIGENAFAGSLETGQCGIKEISIFDVPEGMCKYACEIDNFDPEQILKTKKIKYFDRSTLLALSTIQLSLENASLKENMHDLEKFGVILGTAFGSLWSIDNFGKTMISQGPNKVNPMDFLNTVINSPTSEVNIHNNIMGLSSTISTGFSASLDAIGYAKTLMEYGMADIVAVGGCEELSLPLLVGFEKLNLLSSTGMCTPFDMSKNGVSLGEGCAIFIMETYEHAKQRNARIIASLQGYGTAFDPYGQIQYNPEAEGAVAAMENALQDAGLSSPSDIDYVSASANGNIRGDKMEMAALEKIFSGMPDKVYTGSIKSMIGECYGASGAMQIASTLCAMKYNFIPPNINYSGSHAQFIIPGEAVRKPVTNAMINNFSCNGNNSSIIIKKESIE
ncbi:MAG: beta-ketoacyl-[acyl-carrier-protein] synthase family protein [Spirochaetales bacterium]|nr:beta-ketoacyl-[acyl-carrier-protein] synthase family protein [Spirochaetales bacterium]